MDIESEYHQYEKEKQKEEIKKHTQMAMEAAEELLKAKVPQIEPIPQPNKTVLYILSVVDILVLATLISLTLHWCFAVWLPPQKIFVLIIIANFLARTMFTVITPIFCRSYHDMHFRNYRKRSEEKVERNYSAL